MRGAKLDSMVQAKVGHSTPQELGVEINLDHTGNTTYIDEKLLKLIDNGGALKVDKTVNPLLQEVVSTSMRQYFCPPTPTPLP